MKTSVLLYSSAEGNQGKYGRVVDLVDSLDSGSSVHCGRAGSSPASPTKKGRHPFGCLLFLLGRRDLNNLNATRTSVAGDGSTEPNLNFCPFGQKCKQVPQSPINMPKQLKPLCFQQNGNPGAFLLASLTSFFFLTIHTCFGRPRRRTAARRPNNDVLAMWIVAKALNMSPGNLTFHYPTKEHLLAVLTDMLCHFQWK